MKRNVIILGSTGSIGKQALNVIRKHKDKFNVVGLTCDTDIVTLTQQIAEFKPHCVAVTNYNSASIIKSLVNNRIDLKIFSGADGMNSLAKCESADLIVVAMKGVNGVCATVNAVEAGKTIALANKESLVMAGKYIMNLAKKNNVNIYPVDSEHSTVWKCLNYDFNAKFKKIYLTASGGAFRDLSLKELKHVTYEDAVKHPTWSMGAKISIDSATMMNKGFEFIEAMHLFNAKTTNVDVLIHRQSVIHSMVEFNDNTIQAELATPDMQLPIERALLYPEISKSAIIEPLDFTKLNSLTFEVPDLEKYKCLKIAMACAKIGGLYPCAMACANDYLIEKFAQKQIAFLDIPDYILRVLDTINQKKTYTLDDVLQTKEFVERKLEGMIK